MQTLTDWGLLVAAVICAACAVIAAAVALSVWRRCNAGGDLTVRITAGDRELRRHTDKSITALRHKVDGLDGRMDSFADGQGRLMQEMEHCLKAKDLSPLHEKINQVSERVASSNSTNQGVSEQLKVLTNLILRGSRS